LGLKASSASICNKLIIISLKKTVWTIN
jgi:hypothetical protein